MLTRSFITALALCTWSNAQAATFSYETAEFRGETVANTSFRTANLGPEPGADERRVEITGVETGLVGQVEDRSFLNGISAGRVTEGSFTNVSQGFFKGQDFAVSANINIATQCLSNPTDATCPPRIEVDNEFVFDFSVDQDATLNFAGAYGRGDTRHIGDDSTFLSISDANRSASVFFTGTSSPNSPDNIFDAANGTFTGEIDLEAGTTYRFTLLQGATATGGPVGVPITDTAQFLFGATLSDTPVDLFTTQSQLNAALATVPLPAAGWLLMAAVAGVGAAGRRRKARVS